MTAREFRDRLNRRARRAGLSVPPSLAHGLESYFRLLSLWNEKINLTALPLREPTDETFDRLLVEPLVAAGHLPAQGCALIDIGSGGGSPAIPIKLAKLATRLRMVEAKTRKSAFLREAVRQLGLSDTEVETARFEELLARPELHEAMDVLTLRAVRVESRVLLNVQAFVKPGGQLFLFRGRSGADIPNTIPPPLSWLGTHPLIDALGSRLVILGKANVGARQ